MIATEIIEKKLGEDMKYNPDLIFQNLLNTTNKENKFIDLVLANEEIERVSGNNAVSEEFWTLVEKFETSVESYIKHGLPNIAFEMFGRIFFEAMIININMLDDSLKPNSPITNQDRSSWVKEFLKLVRSSTNYKLGIKHGGTREREGFTWSKERQAQFCNAVEAIPKIKRKRNGKWESIYLWDYIYEQFNSTIVRTELRRHNRVIP